MGSIAEHIAWTRLAGLRPATIEARQGCLRRFERAAGVPAEQATARDVLRWIGCNPQWSPKTRLTYMQHLAAFYTWLVDEGHRGDDPMQRIPRPRVPRGLPRPIPTDRLFRALADARGNPRLYAWLVLACYSGLRRAEIAQLRREDVAGGMVLVRDGKGGRPRMVPAHAVVVEAVRLAPEWEGITPKRLGAVANRHLRKYSQHTLHSLRHWCGTETLRVDGNLREAQEMLGHASTATTAIYTLVTMDDLAQTVARLPVAA